MAIFKTDKFILQRPGSNESNGSASSDVFTVSAEILGEWSANFAHGNYTEISDKVDFLEDQVNHVINDYLPILQRDVNLHDIRIEGLEYTVVALAQSIQETNVRIDNALSRAKINLYHKLMNTVTPLEGEMCVLSDKTPGSEVLATKFSDVVKVRYNVTDMDGTISNFQNINIGETLEITNLNNTQATLVNRAVYYVSKIESYTSTGPIVSEYIDIEVTARSATGQTNLPFYDIDLENPTRSDFYPVFAVQEEELDSVMGAYVPVAGGTMTGKLSINSTRSKLTLWGEQGSDLKFKLSLKINDKDDNNIMEFTETSVKCRKKLHMNMKQIKSLGRPSEPNDAVTKEYFDEALERFDIATSDLFLPGDRVAETNPLKTEQYGFYFQDGTLYFKTSQD